MKRLGREYDKLETLNLLSVLQSDSQPTIYDPASRASFLERIDSGLGRALSSESTLHGVRVQTMFELMVASLGRVRLLKQEDAGECYYNCDMPLKIPDFRVVKEDGTSLLIESKNHHPTDPRAPFRVRQRDLEALASYSALVQTEFRFAIYWSRWNRWTLTDPNVLKQHGQYLQIGLGEAVVASEMADLGDMTIATRYPLALKLIAAPQKPRSISRDGIVEIRAHGFEIYCGDVLVEDGLEKNIAFYLMMYGDWEETGPGAELDAEGLPDAIVFEAQPPQVTPNQGFEMVGSLSSMFSAFYNSVTLEDSRVARLTRYEDPSALAPVIPSEYKGNALPLWRFIQQPNREVGP